MLSHAHAYDVNQVTSSINAYMVSTDEMTSIVEKKGHVLKVGISTLVTRGKIAEIMTDSFKVNRAECSAFAAAGDSGALVISDEDGTRGAILGIVTNANQSSGICAYISHILTIPLIHCCNTNIGTSEPAPQSDEQVQKV